MIIKSMQYSIVSTHSTTIGNVSLAFSQTPAYTARTDTEPRP